MSKSTNDSSPAAPAKSVANEDVALICGRTEDGKGLHILRKRASGIEAGVVQPLEEGKPIHGELVTLKQRGQTPVCDVEVHYAPKNAEVAHTAGATRGHPAQVASDAYRKNWDAIWSRTSDKASLPN